MKSEKRSHRLTEVLFVFSSFMKSHSKQKHRSRNGQALPPRLEIPRTDKEQPHRLRTAGGLFWVLGKPH
ncbi:hypothetical protein CCHR01_07094 [Colletotrichum chrysophilum]|uniref:Uncharacterized protein n=1 Tax=Colletotrichum chrysophilum TaxID=1836956 RepID=A0AAD9EJ38_9PEZI|nr:hypothetical protein CCHR01_07094 [Colletotrichum chrysophilum]